MNEPVGKNTSLMNGLREYGVHWWMSQLVRTHQWWPDNHQIIASVMKNSEDVCAQLAFLG